LQFTETVKVRFDLPPSTPAPLLPLAQILRLSSDLQAAARRTSAATLSRSSSWRRCPQPQLG